LGFTEFISADCLHALDLNRVYAREYAHGEKYISATACAASNGVFARSKGKYFALENAEIADVG
jgi:hypothetical protein